MAIEQRGCSTAHAFLTQNKLEVDYNKAAFWPLQLIAKTI